MANCCGGASSVIIKGGDGLNVTGSGSTSDPYVISGDLEVALRVEETPTVSLSLSGEGNSADPYILSAEATVSINDLTDVEDPTPPVVGDVLQFDGAQWVYGPPPTQAPGQVNTGDGIVGDGTVGDPIGVNVSDTIDTSTDGLYIYIDSNGEVRAQKPTSIPWSGVTNKPSTFTPTAHNHPNTDLTGMLKGTSAPGAGLGVDGDIYFQYV